MKNSIAVAALVLGIVAAESSPTSAFAYDFVGNGIEADTDYIAGFVLLGADLRPQPCWCGRWSPPRKSDEEIPRFLTLMMRDSTR